MNSRLDSRMVQEQFGLGSGARVVFEEPGWFTVAACDVLCTIDQRRVVRMKDQASTLSPPTAIAARKRLHRALFRVCL